MSSATEERILRFWTPILLRTILIVATVILIIGLILMATHEPGYYLQRFHAAQHQDYAAKTTFIQRIYLAAHGDPHAVLVIGLYVLTLVPLARVAFCFFLFLEERDYAYVGFTAYVLIGLVVGILLGRIG